MIAVHHADCVAWLTEYAARVAAGEAEPFDSCATDPPYHLVSIVKRFGKQGSAAAEVPEGGTGAYARASKGFMGKEWDGGDVAFRVETWRAVFDCLKPGAHLVAFSGTRTYHRMACAIEDAGFEIRDQLAWAYGTGFPKSHDVERAINKASGVEYETKPAAGVGFMGPDGPGGYNVTKHQLAQVGESTPEAAEWQGWGTALKPAWEPICLARKPLSEKSVAANVLRWGTGAINIDGCRVEGDKTTAPVGHFRGSDVGATGLRGVRDGSSDHLGRWPANIAHDGSEEVLGAFPDSKDGIAVNRNRGDVRPSVVGFTNGHSGRDEGFGGSGSAARFFYSAKAGPLDRLGSKHVTVKPVDLMRWLCRMITPPGGHILDPFAGSGTTGIAAMAEGFGFTMIEMVADHVADIERKLAFLRGEGRMRVQEHKLNRESAVSDGPGPLFAGGSA